jgi:hypothetical protein
MKSKFRSPSRQATFPRERQGEKLSPLARKLLRFLLSVSHRTEDPRWRFAPQTTYNLACRFYGWNPRIERQARRIWRELEGLQRRKLMFPCPDRPTLSPMERRLWIVLDAAAIVALLPELRPVYKRVSRQDKDAP